MFIVRETLIEDLISLRISEADQLKYKEAEGETLQVLSNSLTKQSYKFQRVLVINNSYGCQYFSAPKTFHIYYFNYSSQKPYNICYYIHLTDEGTEIQRILKSWQCHTAKTVWHHQQGRSCPQVFQIEGHNFRGSREQWLRVRLSGLKSWFCLLLARWIVISLTCLYLKSFIYKVKIITIPTSCVFRKGYFS